MCVWTNDGLSLSKILKNLSTSKLSLRVVSYAGLITNDKVSDTKHIFYILWIQNGYFIY